MTLHTYLQEMSVFTNQNQIIVFYCLNVAVTVSNLCNFMFEEGQNYVLNCVCLTKDPEAKENSDNKHLDNMLLTTIENWYAICYFCLMKCQCCAASL